MLWRRRPRIRKLARKHDAKRLVAALSYHDYVTDTVGKLYDLGASVRRDAALALASISDAVDVDVGAELIAALQDASGEVRRAATWALGARGEKAAVPALTEATLTTGDPRYQASAAAAAEALVDLAGPDTAETFVALAVEQDGNLEPAREILARMITTGGPGTARSASNTATTALGHAEARVQERAANVLVWLGSDSVEPLLRVLEQRRARLPVIRALGSLRDLRATDMLVRLLSDGEPGIRRAAATSLGQISDPRASGPLIDAAADDDFGVRRAAIESVEKLGPLAILPHLGDDADDESNAPRADEDTAPPRADASARRKPVRGTSQRASEPESLTAPHAGASSVRRAS